MITIVSADQIPEPGPRSAFDALPLESLQPGQAIRIPFDMFAPTKPALARAFGTIRTRTSRARKALGLDLRVQKAADAFYVSRVS